MISQPSIRRLASAADVHSRGTGHCSLVPQAARSVATSKISRSNRGGGTRAPGTMRLTFPRPGRRWPRAQARPSPQNILQGMGGGRKQGVAPIARVRIDRQIGAEMPHHCRRRMIVLPARGLSCGCGLSCGRCLSCGWHCSWHAVIFRMRLSFEWLSSEWLSFE